MKKPEKNGGRAFAGIAVGPSGDIYQQTGMTLRDWFAGQAMAAMIGRPITDYPEGEAPGFDDIAVDAFRYADAMIATRTRSETDNG